MIENADGKCLLWNVSMTVVVPPVVDKLLVEMVVKGCSFRRGQR